MVEPGSLVSATIKQEFGEEAMNSLEMSEEEKKEMHDKIEDFLSHGDKVSHYLLFLYFRVKLMPERW